ncbi:alpha-amylase [Streptomyces sp. NPDC058735]|uniref:alpha-amylase n=1 Tax=unclassified Streptomyces TaxID=2593676 RepID=UPI0036CDEEC6
MRSTVMACAVVLAVATPGAAARAETREVPEDRRSAPECVHFTTGWRYTFVTNDCADPHTVKVEYRDGTAVPCRIAPPGAVITFPGYGTQGNEILGVVLCDTGEGV